MILKKGISSREGHDVPGVDYPLISEMREKLQKHSLLFVKGSN